MNEQTIQLEFTLEESRELLKALNLRRKKLRKVPVIEKAVKKLIINNEAAFKIIQEIKVIKKGTL